MDTTQRRARVVIPAREELDSYREALQAAIAESITTAEAKNTSPDESAASHRTACRLRLIGIHVAYAAGADVDELTEKASAGLEQLSRWSDASGGPVLTPTLRSDYALAIEYAALASRLVPERLEDVAKATTEWERLWIASALLPGGESVDPNLDDHICIRDLDGEVAEAVIQNTADLPSLSAAIAGHTSRFGEVLLDLERDPQPPRLFPLQCFGYLIVDSRFPELLASLTGTRGLPEALCQDSGGTSDAV